MLYMNYTSKKYKYIDIYKFSRVFCLFYATFESLKYTYFLFRFSQMLIFRASFLFAVVPEQKDYFLSVSLGPRSGYEL